jgi:hypothetical protein
MRALIAATVLAVSPLAQDRPTAEAQRIPATLRAPVVDGSLEDPVWRQATSIGDLVQVLPVEGAPASEQTEIYVVYDSEAVYVGVRCLDREPDLIRAPTQIRDQRLKGDDHISIYFDPLRDRRTAYGFLVGAAGAKTDALISNGGVPDMKVDFEWEAETAITSEGWTAEIKIPFKELNIDPAIRTWGFNVQRIIVRKNEEVRWASPVQRTPFLLTSEGGDLTGIDAPSNQGRGAFEPYLTGEYTQDTAGSGDIDRIGEFGFDFFYRLRPDVKLSLSHNTDFAETEVDERLVNLTRFALFLPEKRDFFLEDAGHFVFGPSIKSPDSIELLPFFSRRIGLDAQGNQVPIDIAGKLSGQTDRQRFGALAVRTGDLGALDPQELFVGRYSHNLLEQSEAGVLVTHGDPTGATDNTTVGADFNYRTTSFAGDRNLTVSSYVLQSFGEDTGDEGAYHLSVDYPNDVWEGFVSWTVIEDEFASPLGFIPRRAMKQYRGSFAYRPRPHTRVRQYDFRFEPRLVTGMDNETETVELFARPFGVELESGDAFMVDAVHHKEVLDAPFPIHPTAVIPTGTYDFDRVAVAYEGADRRAIQVDARAEFGEFYDGDGEEYEIGVDWRPSAVGSLGVEYEYDDVRLGAGDFTVNLVRLKTALQFGPELSWSNYAQWDDVSDLLGLNSRLRWTIQDGREVFLVLNQGWDYDHDRMVPLDTGVTLKLTYSMAL